MKIKISTAAVRRSKWYEYLIRFVFGGLVTALAGFIAKLYGPEIGGLFLAFPSILPATATLVEKREKESEKEKKPHAGTTRTLRAREAAGADAIGASMGSVGLLLFAVIVWQWITYSVAIVLCIATFAWLLAAVLTWLAHETIFRRIRARFRR